MKACSIDHRRGTIERSALGLLVGVEHEIDGRVADRVRRHPPVLSIQFAHGCDVSLGVDRLQASVLAVLVPGLLVEIPHQSALEAAVDGELDAADAKLLVALVLPDARRCEGWIDAARSDRRPQQRVDADRQLSALLHLLQHAVVGDRDAGMANRCESGLVQFLVIRDAIVELLLRRSRRRRRQTHQSLCRIHQLAVQSPVVIPGDAPTRRLGRGFGDSPMRQRRRVEDVLVSAANEDHGILRRDAIEVVPQRQRLLLELGLVPVTVRNDHVAGLRGLDPGLESRVDVGHRSRTRQIDAWTAAGAVDMVIHQARDHGAALQVDHPRRGPRDGLHLIVVADRHDPVADDRDRFVY